MKAKYRKPASQVRQRLTEALHRRHAAVHGKSHKSDRRDISARLRKGQWDSQSARRRNASGISLAARSGARA